MPFKGLLRFIWIVLAISLASLALGEDSVRVLSLTTGDLAYDSASQRIYASVPSSAATDKNTLAVIDPVAGTIVDTVPIGDNPGLLALADDDSALFVSLNNGNSIVRYDLTTQQIGTPFSLGTDGSGNNYVVKSMAVVPGRSDAVVVLRIVSGSVSQNADVLAYVNGVQQGSAASLGQPAYQILFGDDATQLFTVGGQSIPLTFYRLAFGSDGISVTQKIENSTGVGNANLSYANGQIYSANGSIYDLSTGNNSEIVFPSTLSFLRVVADAATNRVIFSGVPAGNSGGDFSSRLLVYDPATQIRLGSITLPGTVAPPEKLIRWGDNGIALRNSFGQLVLVNSDLLPPPGKAANLAITQAADQDPVENGVPLTYTLTVKNNGPDSAAGVTLEDLLPANAEYVSSNPQGTLSSNYQAVDFSLGDLPAGGMASVQLVVKLYQQGQIHNSARVSSLVVDPDMSDNATGLETSLAFEVIPDRVGEIGLPTNDLIYDSARHRLYASIPSRAADHPNSIAQIDPDAATVGPFLPVGNDPGKLALSDDGKYLYVSLKGDGTVRRIALDTMTPEPVFSMGTSFEGTLYAEDLAVLPGHPDSIAVARSLMRTDLFPSSVDVAVYDNGALRGHPTDEGIGGSHLAFGASSSALYGSDRDRFPSTLYWMTVDENGVTVTDSASGEDSLLEYNFPFDLRFADGLLFTSNGLLIDPEQKTSLGFLEGASIGFNPPNLVTPDGPTRRVYTLRMNYLSDRVNWGFQLNVNDVTSLALLGTMPIPGVSIVPTSLVRWGEDGLAFRTSNDFVYLLRTSLAPSPAPDLDLGVEASASPQPAVVNANLTYIVTITNHGASAAHGVVVRGIVPKDAKRTSAAASQGSCSDTPYVAECSLGTLEPGASAQVTAVVVPTIATRLQMTFRVGGLELDSALENNAATVTSDATISLAPDQTGLLHMSANDLASDERRGVLYASRGTDGGVLQNDIAVIDPAQGKILFTIPVGSDPNQLALSDDGHYLYVAVEGSTKIKRFDLKTAASDLEFAPGPVFGPDIPTVEQLAVMPGHPETVVVLQTGGASIAIYDNGVERPKTDSHTVSDFDFGDSLDQIYSHNGINGSFETFKLTVNASGIASSAGLIIDFSAPHPSSFGQLMRYGGGYLFTGAGLVVDLAQKKLVTVLPGETNFYTHDSLLVPDTRQKRVYFVRGDNINGLSSNFYLDVFNTATYEKLGSLFIPGRNADTIVGQQRSLVRWGEDGIAFIGPNDLIMLARSSLIPVVRGDLNHDRRFNIADIVTALRASVGLTPLYSRDLSEVDLMPDPGTGGRLRGDGKLTMTDLVRLLRILLGMESYPAT